MVKKVIMNLDSLKASGPDHIPVVVLKNCGLELSYILAENYDPVSLLSVVSEVFEKLVNIGIVGHLEKCSLFSDFQYDFISSRSTTYLLTVVSDRIARACNRSGATRAVEFDISSNSNSYSNGWLWVVLNGKSS